LCGGAVLHDGEVEMRQYVTMECTECKNQNYRTQKETRGAEKLELNKYCRFCRQHTSHKERKK
jgi:large subunit ribosomal protein L33